jgi:hypothetical protein
MVVGMDRWVFLGRFDNVGFGGVMKEVRRNYGKTEGL